MTIKSKIFALPIIVLSLASCGQPGDSASSDKRQAGTASLTYVATLTPLNTSVWGGSAVPATVGNATITVNLSTMQAQVSAMGLPPNTMIMQHIHAGTRCPTLANDTNHDGFVDALEAADASGGILIPLDNDLAQIGTQANDYPMTDASGDYTYNESVSVPALLTFLTTPDPNAPGNGFVKLLPGQPPIRNSRVIELHGIPATTALPSTVATLPGLTPQQTLPIACGVLQQQPAGVSPSPSPSPTPTPVSTPTQGVSKML